MKTVKSLLIYSNPSRDHDLIYAKKVSDIAEEFVIEAQITDSDCGCDELIRLLEGCNMMIVLGGDGTMLSAAVPAARLGVPILGINLGKVGFMSAFDASESDKLKDILKGEYVIDSRSLLDVRVEREGREIFRAAALNDAVVSAREIGRMVRVGIFSGGRPVTVLRGDGVIAATPTGSTAYSLSAGGPIIDPRSDCMVLTPISAHTPFARPMVLPLSAEASISIPERAALTVDGQPGVPLEKGDHVVIGKYVREAALIRLKNYDFYDIIGTKLWQTQNTEVGSL